MIPALEKSGAALRKGFSKRWTPIIARCAEIAAGTAVSQDCRRLIAPDLPEDLRFTRCGQHFVVFIEDPAQVVIVDFLHSRADLPARLASLPDPKAG